MCVVYRMEWNICYAIPDGFETSMFGAIEQGEAASVAFFNRWQEEVLYIASVMDIFSHV